MQKDYLYLYWLENEQYFVCNTRARYEAESNVQKAELSLLEAKRTIVALEAEKHRLEDKHGHIREDLDRANDMIKSLKGIVNLILFFIYFY